MKTVFNVEVVIAVNHEKGADVEELFQQLRRELVVAANKHLDTVSAVYDKDDTYLTKQCDYITYET